MGSAWCRAAVSREACAERLVPGAVVGHQAGPDAGGRGDALKGPGVRRGRGRRNSDIGAGRGARGAAEAAVQRDYHRRRHHRQDRRHRGHDPPGAHPAATQELPGPGGRACERRRSGCPAPPAGHGRSPARLSAKLRAPRWKAATVAGPGHAASSGARRSRTRPAPAARRNGHRRTGRRSGLVGWPTASPRFWEIRIGSRVRVRMALMVGPNSGANAQDGFKGEPSMPTQVTYPLPGHQRIGEGMLAAPVGDVDRPQPGPCCPRPPRGRSGPPPARPRSRWPGRTRR